MHSGPRPGGPWATCVGVVRVHLGPAAHAGRVHGLHAQGLQRVPQLLDVAVLAVQGHLQLNAHLVLIRHLLQEKDKGRKALMNLLLIDIS